MNRFSLKHSLALLLLFVLPGTTCLAAEAVTKSEAKENAKKQKEAATDVYRRFCGLSSAPVSNPSLLRRGITQVLVSSRSSQEGKFFKELLPQALALMWDKKIPVSATVSMAIYESNYGNSGLARLHQNYFGIKAFADWKGPRSSMATRDEGVAVQANFRKYTGMADSAQNYASFLSTKKHYRRAFASVDGVDFVRRVLEGGYCPDKDYLDNIRTLMARHSLLDLDKTCVAVFQEEDLSSGY